VSQETARPAQTDSSGTGAGLSPGEFERLLGRSEKALQQGNRAGACALARALTRQYPDEPRAWRLLADITNDPQESQAAREQVRLLHGQATPVPARTAAAQLPRWVYPFASAVLLIALIWFVGSTFLESEQASQPQAQELPSAPPDATLTMLTTTPLPGVVARSTSTSTPISTPTSIPPTPTVTPAPMPRPTVQGMGTIVQHNGWHATLLQPDYAQVLSESVADVQARGQFALVVLAVGNTHTSARRIPRELFGLLDDQGRLYHPVPGASSAYLAVYERGQRGDLALEDEIPPGGGMFSVPLLFDVPPDVNELILTMGPDAAHGWQFLQRAPASGELPPTATPNAGP
jgi:hypothetical protein